MSVLLAGCGLSVEGEVASGSGVDSGTLHVVDASKPWVIDVKADRGQKPPHVGDARAKDVEAPPRRMDATVVDARLVDAKTDDVEHPKDVAEEPSPPAACTVPPGACVSALPPGWGLVTYATSPGATCSSQYVGGAVVSNPAAQTGACGCVCDVTSAPTCNQGELARMVNTATPCNQTGNPLDVNGSGCTPWATGSGGLAPYSQSTPLALTAGTCMGAPTMDLSNVTSDPGLLCTPPTQCEEQLCEGGPPAGFSLCVAQPGPTSSCPAGWGTPMVVGDSVGLVCSACNCDVNSQSSCSGASVEFFSDPGCTMLASTVSIDGTCNTEQNAGAHVMAFEYFATLNQVCVAEGPNTATVSPTNPQTICCKP
jgi:hypothetical protein